MTFDEFIKEYIGKKVDWDGVYGGQCVDLFRQYVNDVLELPQPAPVVGARNLWENYSLDKNLFQYYDKISNSPLAVPRKGDIVIWNANAGGGFGHVAMFIEGGIMSFKSFDQNWPTLDVCTITEHNYRNVYGWLRPKISVAKCEDEVNVLKEQIKVLKSNIGALQSELELVSDKAKFWYDALKLFELPSNTKWKDYKALVNKNQKLIETQKEKIAQLEKAISTNVTPLNSKKDDKYVYDIWDLVDEILRRIRG